MFRNLKKKIIKNQLQLDFSKSHLYFALERFQTLSSSPCFSTSSPTANNYPRSDYLRLQSCFPPQLMVYSSLCFSNLFLITSKPFQVSREQPSSVPELCTQECCPRLPLGLVRVSDALCTPLLLKNIFRHGWWHTWPISSNKAAWFECPWLIRFIESPGGMPRSHLQSCYLILLWPWEWTAQSTVQRSWDAQDNYLL